MRRLIVTLTAMLGLALLPLTAVRAADDSAPQAEVGKPAPDFTLVDTKGTSHSLSSFKGQTVVLEWLNHQCPFVKKHYGSGNMQKLQESATAEGVVWLSVNSSAEGKQGHTTPEEADKLTSDHKAKPSAVLLDSSGKVGKIYGAKTTPHMFVIDKDRILQYAGAIDSIPSGDKGDIDGAQNYVRNALDQLKAGQKVHPSKTVPYGCAVKY